MARAKSEKDPIIIMVAGQPRKGKSTALNNLFNLELEARPSAGSVTRSVIPKMVTVGSQKLLIVDTPGLGSLDLKIDDAMKEIDKSMKGLDFTLVYCLAVSPNISINLTDEILIKNLIRFFHKKIWEKCILLLTFCDLARDHIANEKLTDRYYLDYIKEHSIKFQQLLQANGVSSYGVKTVFDYESKRDREQSSFKEIVAVPVMKEKIRPGMLSIMPGILSNAGNWTDIVFAELLKKTSPSDRLRLSDFRHASLTDGATIASGFGGTLAGAGIGAAIGIVGGPVGIAIGASVGAATGGLAGMFARISISTASYYHEWTKENPKEKVKKLVEKSENK